jgi:hypothetical protein
MALMGASLPNVGRRRPSARDRIADVGFLHRFQKYAK